MGSISLFCIPQEQIPDHIKVFIVSQSMVEVYFLKGDVKEFEILGLLNHGFPLFVGIFFQLSELLLVKEAFEVNIVCHLLDHVFLICGKVGFLVIGKFANIKVFNVEFQLVLYRIFLNHGKSASCSSETHSEFFGFNSILHGRGFVLESIHSGCTEEVIG